MKLIRLPCETCKEDTLHVGLKCNHCGNISERQSFTDAMRRKLKKRTEEVGAFRALNEIARNTDKIYSQKVQWEKKNGVDYKSGYAIQKNKNPSLRRGRERIKI